MSNLTSDQREFYAIRRNEMISLRTKDKLPLAEIAMRYGISRERVRQIIADETPHAHYGKGSRYESYIMAHPELTNSELVEITGLSIPLISKMRSKTVHAIGGVSTRVGALWEKKISDKLTELGIPNKLMPAHSQYNILAYDVVKIEVKASLKTFKPPTLKNVSPTYSWNLGNHYPGKADIFILVAGSMDNIFVIPALAIEEKFETMHCLRFAYPTSRPEIGFWQSYKDRYDLIERIRIIKGYGPEQET